MTIKNKFEFGDPVYIIADPEQNLQVVIGFFVSPNGITYVLSNEAGEMYDLELSTTKRVF